MPEKNTKPKIALITGANRGLGLETARQLAAQDYYIVLTSRDGQKGANALRKLKSEGYRGESLELDVTQSSAIDRLKERMEQKGMRLDVLVNNAGISMDGFNEEVARNTLETNFYGPLRVTRALRELLNPGGHTVMVSSGLGTLNNLGNELKRRFTAVDLNLEDLEALVREFITDVADRAHDQKGWPTSAYSVSKIALNALVRVWAAGFAEGGLYINAVSPGWARTDMGGRSAPRTVTQGAASIVWAALPQCKENGGFFLDGRRTPW